MARFATRISITWKGPGEATCQRSTAMKPQATSRQSAPVCREFSVGDPVLVTLIRACGSCHSCCNGYPVTCETPFDRVASSPLRMRDSDRTPIEQARQHGSFRRARCCRPKPGPRYPVRHGHGRGLSAFLRRHHWVRGRDQHGESQGRQQCRCDRSGWCRADCDPGCKCRRRLSRHRRRCHRRQAPKARGSSARPMWFLPMTERPIARFRRLTGGRGADYRVRDSWRRCRLPAGPEVSCNPR